MTQQGSASFTIVISGLAALIVGAMMLTFFFYPLIDAFMNAAFWQLDTLPGIRLIDAVEGIWLFWGAILLMGILSFVWVKTRQ